MEKDANNFTLISASIEFLKELLTSGKVYEAYQELIKADQQYKKDLENNDDLKNSFHQTATLILNHLDKSKQVLQHAKHCIRGYEKVGDIESQIISRVHYADALFALGYVQMAENNLKETYLQCEEYNISHAKVITCFRYANVLSALGKLQLALKHYEEGLQLALVTNLEEEIIYGKIHYGINNLRLNYKLQHGFFEGLLTQSKASGYHYLADLAFAAYCIQSTIDNKTVSLQILNHQPVLPVANLFYYSNLIQTGSYNGETINNFLAILGQCEGIKFYKEQIFSTLEKLISRGLIENPIHIDFANRWLNSYSPASENDLSTKLKTCNYRLCEARCCYDGVYLQEGEEETITAVVKSNPGYFKHLPNNFIVDGSWEKIKGRKTAVRDHHYFSPDFPNHFEKTRCVFAESDGACSLQTVSTQLTANAWTYKPKACKTHPLQTTHFEFWAPPTTIEEDKFDLGISYPGYVSYTPCGINRADGNTWLDELASEIENFQSED